MFVGAAPAPSEEDLKHFHWIATHPAASLGTHVITDVICPKNTATPCDACGYSVVSLLLLMFLFFLLTILTK